MYGCAVGLKVVTVGRCRCRCKKQETKITRAISATTRLIDTAILPLLSWLALVGTAEGVMAKISYQACDSRSR